MYLDAIGGVAGPGAETSCGVGESVVGKIAEWVDRMSDQNLKVGCLMVWEVPEQEASSRLH